MKGSPSLAKNIEKRDESRPKDKLCFKLSIQEKFNNKLEEQDIVHIQKGKEIYEPLIFSYKNFVSIQGPSCLNLFLLCENVYHIVVLNHAE